MPRETLTVLRAQRDRARDLTKSLTRRLYEEHGKKCSCGKPSEGDCGTLRLLHDADRHLAHWGMGVQKESEQ